MLINDLINSYPLNELGFESEDIIPAGGIGAVMARAGVGKTSFLVQLAINSMLKNINVLHISLDEPVNKVTLWYKEVFHLLTDSLDQNEKNLIWESILTNRFIMTFRVAGFNVPVLEERLSDLKEQNIFSPEILIIDGLPFDESNNISFEDVQSMSKKYSFHTWLTVRTHRDEKCGTNGIPVIFSHFQNICDAAIILQPVGKEIHVKAVKGLKTESNKTRLFLNPSTMMLTKKQDQGTS